MRGRITFGLIAACVVVFIIQQFVDLNQFAFTPATAFQQPWTFVTAIFLHANVSHIFFNMFALFIFGIYFESMVSERNYLALFFLSGILGSIGYMFTAADSTIPAIGASGAIYGIIGALAAMRPTAIIYLGFLPLPMILAAVFYALTEFLGLFGPSSIAHGAHLFGLFFGVAYGLHLRHRQGKAKFFWQR